MKRGIPFRTTLPFLTVLLLLASGCSSTYGSGRDRGVLDIRSTNQGLLVASESGGTYSVTLYSPESHVLVEESSKITKPKFDPHGRLYYILSRDRDEFVDSSIVQFWNNQSKTVVGWGPQIKDFAVQENGSIIVARAPESNNNRPFLDKQPTEVDFYLYNGSTVTRLTQYSFDQVKFISDSRLLFIHGVSGYHPPAGWRDGWSQLLFDPVRIEPFIRNDVLPSAPKHHLLAGCEATDGSIIFTWGNPNNTSLETEILRMAPDLSAMEHVTFLEPRTRAACLTLDGRIAYSIERCLYCNDFELKFQDI